MRQGGQALLPMTRWLLVSMLSFIMAVSGFPVQGLAEMVDAADAPTKPEPQKSVNVLPGAEEGSTSIQAASPVSKVDEAMGEELILASEQNVAANDNIVPPLANDFQDRPETANEGELGEQIASGTDNAGGQQPRGTTAEPAGEQEFGTDMLGTQSADAPSQGTSTVEPQATQAIALTDSVVVSRDVTLSGEDVVNGTFTVSGNCFGYVQVLGTNLHVVLKRNGVVMDEWDANSAVLDSALMVSGIHGPLSFSGAGYQLVVTKGNGASSGSMSKIGYRTIAAPGGLTITNIESEPNGTVGTANNLGFGQYVYGTAVSGGTSMITMDTDCYRFELGKRQRVLINVDATCYSDTTSIEVLDSSGNVVFNDGRGLIWHDNLRSTVLDCGNLESGRYFVRFYNTEWVSSTDTLARQWYRLKLTATAPVPVKDESCLLLRGDGSFWYCSNAGEPVASGAKATRSIRTLFIESNVTSVVFSFSVRYMLEDSVERVVFLTDASGRNACTEIQEDSFRDWQNLHSVTNFEKTSVRRIGRYAFYNCDSLESLSLPKTLQAIQGWAFDGCGMLSSLPGLSETSLVSVDSCGFEECSSLTSLAFPSTTVSIGTSAFNRCASLKRIEFPSPECVSFGAFPFQNTPLDTASTSNNAWIYVDYWLLSDYKDQIGSWNNYLNHIVGMVSTSRGSLALAKTFPDVTKDSWYADVVLRAAGLRLINGYADGRFGPNDNITRGQVAVILWNMAGQPAAGAGARSFPDVAPGKYYYNAVRWASSAGVVSGYGSGKFGPNDSVTREQLAVMLANYARSVARKPVSGSAVDYSSMKDKAIVSSWARTSVGWCFRNQILSGTKDGKVNPQGNATRAQASKMVVYLYNLLG